MKHLKLFEQFSLILEADKKKDNGTLYKLSNNSYAGADKGEKSLGVEVISLLAGNKEGKPKPKEDNGSGWIVTFADLMSLLLTFFILLLIVALSVGICIYNKKSSRIK